MDLSLVLHHSACGGLAAAGFGVLFNVRWRGLPWCAASGALALAVRTVAAERGWSLEAATFVAALTVSVAVLLLPWRAAVSRSALHVVGGIPMVPGGFAAKAILGLFSVTTPHAPDGGATLLPALEATLHVVFVLGTLGAGLAIPTLLLRVRENK